MTECRIEILVSRLVDIGRAQGMISNILESEVFDNLSKHDPYWVSEHEVEGEKLHDIRSRLCFVKENLEDARSIMRGEYED